MPNDRQYIDAAEVDRVTVMAMWCQVLGLLHPISHQHLHISLAITLHTKGIGDPPLVSAPIVSTVWAWTKHDKQ